MNSHPLLLVVDDELTILKALKEALEDEKYQVETLSDGSKALDLIGKLIPDLVLLDIFMPNVNGLKLLEKIKIEYPQQKVMIISGFGNIQIAIEAVKKGAIDFIEKPLNLDEILTKISFLKSSDETNTQLSDSQLSLHSHNIIGQSYLFLELVQQISQIARLKLPLLIYGQHGTGKTLISQYIHYLNKFPEDNFFKINCSTLTEKSFSESIKENFSETDCTLFFKNIEYLNIKQQKKLLSFLEEPQNKNIKIIASSCTPIFDLLKTEKFIEALFHKLNVTPIEIPPLNKRRYDIPLLIDFYLKKFNEKYKKSITLNTRSIRILRNHNWTSNVTELRILLEKIVSTNEQDSYVVPPNQINDFLSEKKAQIIEEQSFLRFNSLKEATLEFEKNFLIHLLRKNRYDLKQVCDQLNLTTIQLRDKMLKFNINIKI